MCYNVAAYKLTPVGGEGFEPSWLVADGCQDRYVCQFHHPPTTETWGECFHQDATPPQPSKLDCSNGILFCQWLFVVILHYFEQKSNYCVEKRYSSQRGAIISYDIIVKSNNLRPIYPIFLVREK